MWCSDCQQDVPAVATSVGGPLVCPRCELQLKTTVYSSDVGSDVADTGLALEEMDRHDELAPPLTPWQREEMEQRMRLIGQRLRTAYRHDPDFGVAAAPPSSWGPGALEESRLERLKNARPVAGRQPVDPARATASTRFISLLLCLGLSGFVAGVGALTWSSAFGLAGAWQWGMTLTIAAEGTLIVALAWMAARLWQNSRRLNQQIDGVDQQIRGLEQAAGGLSAHRLSSSQYYYEHFGQGASDHMLLANLRGQVDQLSTRLAG